jgi:hypothetical protein
MNTNNGVDAMSLAIEDLSRRMIDLSIKETNAVVKELNDIRKKFKLKEESLSLLYDIFLNQQRVLTELAIRGINQTTEDVKDNNFEVN